MMHVAPLLVVLTILTSCRSLPKGSINAKIAGTWRLYESGDAPGGGTYVVKSIRPVPAQTITLSRNGRFKAEGSDPFFISLYVPIQRYRAEKTPTTENYFRFGYWDSKTRRLVYQGLTLKNDTLRLTPLCYEGCHFSFLRID
ncbi:hypothetical protein [Spirosoma validum]|uniref:Uncharacterized protein n=1 Tax=Spirosoma validum TaxID=2771355 RepID=A0A927B8T2_9BACT|nr:hypothetical protein [Spirosoma validum]MBD2757835.1 hypothetical protein [Spirosoma validum]